MSIVDGLPSGAYVKGSEFEGGLTVKFLKAERVQASNPQYGDDSGMTNRYTLEVDGEEKQFENTSAGLVRAVKAAGIEAGEMALVTRTGQGMQTEWSVEKLGKEV